MKYKDFTWPHNPRTYTIEYKRAMAQHKVPYGRYHLQDLGPACRVMKGEGEFVGEDAYETFKALASVFYSDGPGVLVHPVWQAANVYFVELSLAQEPRRDYVRYTFTFWEGYGGYQAYARSPQRVQPDASGTSAVPGANANAAAAETGQVWHTVVRGDNLWTLSKTYGVDLTAVIALNPQLKNPNLIVPGERVRMK